MNICPHGDATCLEHHCSQGSTHPDRCWIEHLESKLGDAVRVRDLAEHVATERLAEIERLSSRLGDAVDLIGDAIENSDADGKTTFDLARAAVWLNNYERAVEKQEPECENQQPHRWNEHGWCDTRSRIRVPSEK